MAFERTVNVQVTILIAPLLMAPLLLLQAHKFYDWRAVMKVHIKLLATFLSVLLIACPAMLQAESSSPISIFYPPVKPFKYNIMVNILQHLDQQHNYGLKIELFPWKRAYMQGLNGQGGVLGLSKNEERLKIFDYSHELYVDEILLVTLKEKAFSFKDINDLRGKSVGGNAGSSYGDEFERGKAEVFTYVEDFLGASNRLRKLLVGRIDVALIGPGRAGFQDAINQDPKLQADAERFSILPLPLVKDPNYLGFAKTMGMNSFLQRLNQDLKQAKESGEIDAIIEAQIRRMAIDN